jgi:hypothetical protein
MSIYRNVKKVRAVIASESVDNMFSPAGDALNTAAMAALKGGMASPAWKSFMAVFADNPEQLTRLTEQAPGETPYVTQMRAYVLTASICDHGTNLNMPSEFDQRIDGEENTAGNPPVTDVPDDPTSEIANLRPPALKTIRD